jgi:hypothetical protein
MGAAASLWPLLAGVDVEGATSCPTASAVESRLASSREGRLVLSGSPSSLNVRLLDDDGRLLGERALAMNGTCDELADAAAVLVSAWTITVPEIALPELIPQAVVSVLEPGGPKATEAPIAMARPLAFAEPRLASRYEARIPVGPALELARARHRSSQHDLFAGGAHAIGGGFTSATGFVGGYRYVPWPWVGVETRVSLYSSGLSSLGSEVLAGFGDPPLVELPDLFAPRWTVATAGSLSLARGSARAFGIVGGAGLDLRAITGIGVGGVARHDDGSARTLPIFEAGGGLSLNVFREAIGADVEFVDLFFADRAGGLTHSVQVQALLRISPDPAAWRAWDPVDAPEKGLGLRFILTPKAGTSFTGGYTTTRALSLDVAFDIFDFLGVEALGLYAFPSPSSLTEILLDRGKLTPPLAALAQLRWAVAGGIRVNVLRGRFAPLGLPVEGDSTLYVAGGAGVGGWRVPCTPGAALESGVCPMIDSSIVDPSSVSFVHAPEQRTVIGHFGAGLHFGIIEPVAVSLELRDFVFRASHLQPDSFDPVQSASRATIHVVLAQAGISVIL